MDLVTTYEKTEKVIYLNDATAESFKVSLLDGIVTIRNKKVINDRFRKCFDMDEREFLQFVQIVKENLLSHLTDGVGDTSNGIQKG